MEEAEAALEAGAAKVLYQTTLFPLVWLLPCVSDKMRLQISNLSEYLTTLFTHCNSHFCISPRVVIWTR